MMDVRKFRQSEAIAESFDVSIKGANAENNIGLPI